MKNLNKGVKVIVAVILAILLFFVIFWFTKSESEKMILSCYKYYRKSMSLDYVGLNKTDKKIKILFKLNGMWKEDDVAETYKAIINKFYKDSDSKYKQYIMEISFVHLEEEIVISDINKSLDSIEFHTYACRIYIKDIAKLFPYISKLHLCSAYFDDISEIKGFTNLKYVFFDQGITYEEEKYILSIYPECEVDAQVYNDLK